MYRLESLYDQQTYWISETILVKVVRYLEISRRDIENDPKPSSFDTKRLCQ